MQWLLFIQALSWGRVLLPFEKATTLFFIGNTKIPHLMRNTQNPYSHHRCLCLQEGCMEAVSSTWERTGPLLLESRRADFSNFFHYLKFLLSDHSKLHHRCSIYCTKLIYFYKKKSTCSLPWKQQSTRWPSGAKSWQDSFLLLHSLPQIHLHMRISAPHHQGKAQPSLASAVAPQKYAERKIICFPMFEAWTNNLPLQLQ